MPAREWKISLEKKLFHMADEALAAEAHDARSKGPRWLHDDRIATLVREELLYWNGTRYRLLRYVIMPNHLHVLMEPLRRKESSRAFWALREITKGLKGYTARQANKTLGRRGKFWQDESFDHWIRNEGELKRVVEYIDLNPVAAGLCRAPQEWRWSSAWDEVGQTIESAASAQAG